MESATIAPQNEAVGLGLYALGAIVIASALVSVTSVGSRHLKFLSGVMVVYGLVMLFVGGSMAGGLITMTTGTPFYGYAMLIVGALMVGNGATMSRTDEMKEITGIDFNATPVGTHPVQVFKYGY